MKDLIIEMLQNMPEGTTWEEAQEAVMDSMIAFADGYEPKEETND